MTTSKAAFRCPHCNGPMHTRTSRSVSRYLRQGFLACIDPECGATYGIDHEITHQIRPSGKPDPLVAIRTSPPRKAPLHPSVPVLPANDDGLILAGLTTLGGSEVPPPANDDDTIGAVATS